MKKILALLLAICMGIVLAACASVDKGNAAQAKSYTVTYDNTMDPAVYEAVPAYQFNGDNLSWMIPYGMNLYVNLDLASEGTYTLKAGWTNQDPSSAPGDPAYIDIHVEATGTYTAEGDKVTISAASAATAVYEGGAYITEQAMFDAFSFAEDGKSTGTWTGAEVPEVLACVPATVFTVTEEGAIVTWAPVNESEAGNPHASEMQMPEGEAEAETQPEEEPEAEPADSFVMLSPEWDAVTITFFVDGTYKFELAAYSIAEEGTWVYADGVLTVTKPSGNTVASVMEGDMMKLDYVADASEQLIGQFKSTDWNTFFGAESAEKASLEVFSPEWDAVLLTLNSDGTYKFELAAYGIAEEGTWVYADGMLTVTKPSGNTVASTMDGEDMKLDYVSDASEQLIGQFRIPAADLSFLG